nr:unnamed protein product [Callosobruchus analis]
MASRTAWQRGVARRPDRRQCGIVVVGQVCRMVWFGRNAFSPPRYTALPLCGASCPRPVAAATRQEDSPSR